MNVEFSEGIGQSEQIVSGRNTSSLVKSACVGVPTLGTLFMGANTFQDVFGNLEFLFRVGVEGKFDGTMSKLDLPRLHPNIHRVPWKRLPSVDLLLVRQPESPSLRGKWMDHFLEVNQAQTIILFHHQDEIIGSDSWSIHNVCKRLKTAGHQVRTWTVSSEACGAALWNQHVVTIATRCPGLDTAALPVELRIDLPPRPCRNVLREYKVPASRYIPLDLASWSGSRTHPVYTNYLGDFRGAPVFSPEGPFIGNDPSSWIYVEKKKAVRHLLAEEWRSLKGCDGKFGAQEQYSCKALAASVESHVMAVLGETVVPFLHSETPSLSLGALDPSEVPSDNPAVDDPEISPSANPTFDSTPASSKDDPFSWEPPDLSVGGEFYTSTVAKLTAACAKLPEDERRQAFLDGLDDLTAHRGNYSGHGPTKLVLLWWEWPEEHWKALRFGISMNFFREPPPGILPNMKMDEEQLQLAEKFIEQLSSLGVLGDAIKDGVEIRNNFPLFLVPKAGQPGEWRCIADGKAGGQNACCISDPCLMTAPDHILPYMYRDGYTAVADMSKYFHCFTTVMGEWIYFGLIHPRTGEVLYYKRLPMGTCNSPAGSGRLGAALVRELVESCELFQGTPVDNSKVGMILNRPYNPRWGDGRVLMGGDELPAVLIKCHIDDFILHGPNFDKTARALMALMDHLFRKGLVCQHVKTEPPSQCVKYCGFLYDTRPEVPTLRIPDDKISRALALVRYLLRGTIRRLARLSTAKVIGFLQSLVPATPSNIGASFLRHLYDDLHSLTDAKLRGTVAYYYTSLDLSPCSRLELLWWEQSLARGFLSCQHQMSDMGTLSVNWGDGSGTGTGGTENWVSMDTDTRLSPLESWMGIWKDKVHHFSSNWKELRTLAITLQRLKQKKAPLQGRMMWYMTDNQVTYDICRSSSSTSKELMTLIHEIRLLELEMGCRVEVIHVPGKLMITQGTDGLSRGMVLQSFAASDGILPLLNIWRPAECSPALLAWALATANVPNTYRLRPWLFRQDLDDWSLTPLLHRFTFWCPSPHFGKQCILQALAAWVESPFDSGHLFLIPRIMQRDFGRVHKHVKFIGVFWDVPLTFTPVVPFLLFYLPPFNRLAAYLEKSDAAANRVDTGPPLRPPTWVKQQIETLQRM